MSIILKRGDSNANVDLDQLTAYGSNRYWCVSLIEEGGGNTVYRLVQENIYCREVLSSRLIKNNHKAFISANKDKEHVEMERRLKLACSMVGIPEDCFDVIEISNQVTLVRLHFQSLSNPLRSSFIHYFLRMIVEYGKAPSGKRKTITSMFQQQNAEYCFQEIPTLQQIKEWDLINKIDTLFADDNKYVNLERMHIGLSTVNHIFSSYFIPQCITETRLLTLVQDIKNAI